MAKPKIKLQLSNGYYLRFNHLSILLKYIVVSADNSRFTQKSLSNELGMSPRMIENLNSYGVAFGLITPGNYKPTELGILMDKEDIFFDMIDTLWFLHYVIASNSRYVVWNRLVNKVFKNENIVSTEVSRPYFKDLFHYYSEKTIDKHLAKEINAFFNAYTEQNFSKLEYIKKVSSNTYKINNDLEIPPLSILASCYLYRDRFMKGSTGIDIESLIKDKNSPGRVFNLSEDQLRLLLEKLNSKRLISLESRANLDQVRFETNKTWLDIVELFY
jgi:hypothetical protein